MANSSRVPDWLLEQLALGELDATQSAAVRQRLTAEPDGAQRLAALQRSNDEILGTIPSAVMARRIEGRLPPPPRKASRPRWSFAGVALPMMAAAGLAFLLVPSGQQMANRRSATTDLEEGRVKGMATPAVRIHRQQGEQPELLGNGAITHANDVLQLSYVAGGHRYGALVSIDGRGHVTLHAPRSATGPATLEPSGEVLLPFAYQLDDAPDFERFFLVYSDAPVSVEAVLNRAWQLAADPAAARAAPLPLPPGLQQVSVFLTKVSP